MSGHARKTRKTILIYGLSATQRLALIGNAEKAGIFCKPISDYETTHTIEALLSGKTLAVMPRFPLEGKFALLDGFNGQEQIGTALINQIAGGVIKAVRTSHNSQWRFCDLCSAIQLEHRSMKEWNIKLPGNPEQP